MSEIMLLVGFDVRKAQTVAAVLDRATGGLSRHHQPYFRARRFRRMTPQARWVELQGPGHCPMLDDAQLTTNAILELTQRGDAGRGTPQPAAVAASSR